MLGEATRLARGLREPRALAHAGLRGVEPPNLLCRGDGRGRTALRQAPDLAYKRCLGVRFSSKRPVIVYWLFFRGEKGATRWPKLAGS